MGRPTTKTELIHAANEDYHKMQELITSMTDLELLTPFQFEDDLKKTQAHWKRDKNLRDVLTHLYEWHQLTLNWVGTNRNSSENMPYLPKPYNWKTYGMMNIAFWKKHQNTTFEEAQKMLDDSHEKIMELIDSFSDEELFTKGEFPWVGNTALGSYFISNTTSHYNWAIKKIKAHKKNCKNKAL